MTDFLMPKEGTLERILLNKLIENGDEGVTYLDFIGTDITEENIDQLIMNLKTGMFEAENDYELRKDA